MAEPTAAATGPLAGITVIDFTRVLSGPYATMTLADLGADVIKIEERGVGDDTRRWGPPFVSGESAYFLSVNRNKRSVELDLKSAKDLATATQLIAGADIVVENFRPGVTERLGLAYEQLKNDNPGLVYASISGYGRDSSESSKPGYDPVIQARSGLMSITGPSDGNPSRVGIAISDISSSMWVLVGILAALHERTETGRGQHIDVSLLDSQTAWLTNVAGSWFANGEHAQRYGTAHPSIVPSDTFPTKDGIVMIAAGNDRMWARCAEALGRADLATDPRFVTNAQRVAYRDALREVLIDILATATTDHWLERFGSADIPAERVNTIGQALSDPLLEERGMIVRTEHPVAGTIKSLACPIHFSEHGRRAHSAPPVLGQHSTEVLASLAGVQTGALGDQRAPQTPGDA